MWKNLIPFALSTALYFYMLPTLEPSLLTVVIKCLPILALAGAVYYPKPRRSITHFESSIANGLILSSIGDACLVYEKLFPLGMVAFACAHCFYILAFGLRPAKIPIGIAVYAIGTFAVFNIIPNIKDDVIYYGIPVYSLFLSTMSWRALARMTDGPDAWSWPKILCGVGTVLFIISDTTICFHDLQKPIPYGKVIIMTTYYAAQFGITMSVMSAKGSAQTTAKVD